MPIPPAIAPKLARTLALLHNANQGERRAAWAATERLLASAGLDWRDIAESVASPAAQEPAAPAAPTPRTSPEPDDSILVKSDGSAEIDASRLCELVDAIRCGTRCDDWTTDFLNSLEARAGKFSTVYLSVKMVTKLTQLLKRVPA